MTGTRTHYARLSDLPLDSATRWLSREELAVWTGMRSPFRKATWLAGRIVSKRLLLELLAGEQFPLADVRADNLCIESRSTQTGHGERPEVSIGGQLLPLALSIAHTKLGALAAAKLNADATLEETVTLGVDLVCPSDAGKSLHWTFTDAERRWLATSADCEHCAARLWSMKEALYKACQRGEGFAPRDIEVAPGQPPRYPLFNAVSDLVRLQCWRIDGHLAALAIVKPTAAASLTNDRALALARAA